MSVQKNYALFCTALTEQNTSIFSVKYCSSGSLQGTPLNYNVFKNWMSPSDGGEKLMRCFTSGRGVDCKGRLYCEGAGGALHAEEVPHPQEEILHRGKLNSLQIF